MKLLQPENLKSKNLRTQIAICTTVPCIKWHAMQMGA